MKNEKTHEDRLMDSLVPDEILEGLDTNFVGSNLHLFDELVSTNLTAHEMAMSGVPEGTVIIADSQSEGRGRRGRPWFSAPGDNQVIPAGCKFFCEDGSNSACCAGYQRGFVITAGHSVSPDQSSLPLIS